LTQLVITFREIKPEGARYLSKALQYNNVIADQLENIIYTILFRKDIERTYT